MDIRNNTIFCKLLILLPVILGVMSVVVDFLPAKLPAELATYVNRKDLEIDFNLFDVIGISAFFTFVIGTIGLLKFKKPFRSVYLVSSLVFLASKAGYEATALTGYQAAIDDLVKISIGVVIGVVYFSPMWREHKTSD